MSNERMLYCLKFKEGNNLQKQLDWANKSLGELRECTFKIPMLRGEIYKYHRTANKLCYFIVMGDSCSCDEEVLICPIYVDKGPDTYMPGIKIGMIPELSLNRMFVASISEIHFISKSKVVKSENLGEAQFYGKLLKSVFVVIISSYKELITRALKDDTDYVEINVC